MTNPAPEQTTNEQTTDAAQQAAQQAAEDSQRRLQAGQITPDQFLDELRALPEKIVDAIREAYPSAPKQSPQPPATGQPAGEASTPVGGGKWFGYGSFAEFWTGKK